MKHFYKIMLIIITLILLFCGCNSINEKTMTDAVFHIGLITIGTGNYYDEEALRGAEELIRLYGNAKNGGMIRNLILLDKNMHYQSQINNTISLITSLADDPLMKAIVVNQAAPGTAEAFRQIREKRPDILLFAGESWEDPSEIQRVSDLVISYDFITRGYTLVWAAKKLGAQTFVHISYPEHLIEEIPGLRHQIMEQACKDLKINFVYGDAPYPTMKEGFEKNTREYIYKMVPQWIRKYGKQTAFFCTYDRFDILLIEQLLIYGGIFMEPNFSSPFVIYPEALELESFSDTRDFQIMRKELEIAITTKGGAGRFGTGPYSYAYALSASLAEYAKQIIEGKAKKGDYRVVNKLFGIFTPGAGWNYINYIDAKTGTKAENHLLVYMDPYIFGKGFIRTTRLKIPDKYFNMRYQTIY